ncbi:MAG: hypothetical protein EOO01_21530 [Chitinophagaceae bacterium]|nr:MAG: hypothetical protein EOO01_21530 [Chitinophagaceae bacterium]
MKNKIGLLIGFIFGALMGFLGIFILSKLHPEEDLAGIFIFTLLVSGLLFALVGLLIHRRMTRKKI